MKTSSKNKHLRALAALSALLLGPVAHAQINFNGTTYSQNFDAMIASGTVANAFSATLNIQGAVPAIAGWQAAKIGGDGSAATALTANAGANSSGLVFSYGTGTATDRALGILASGSNIFAMGPAFKNTSGHTITSVTVRFTAEFWRSSTTLQNTLTFGYGVKDEADAATTLSNYLSAPTLSALTALNIVGPQPVASNGALDGNATTNKKTISVLIEGLNWADGQILYLRWTDINDGGNDAGLAIDDFSLIEGVYVDPSDVSRGTAGNLFTPTSFAGAAFGPTNNAVFDGAAATTTLSGAVVAKGLKFNTDGHVLTGGVSDSISLTSGSIEVNGSITGTISGIITGTAGLQTSGAGTLVLSGANTFTGAVTVGEGRLVIPSDAALGNADNDIAFAGTLATSGNLSLGSGRSLSGSGAIETGASGILTISGPLAGASLNIVGATTVNLNGPTNSANAFSFAEPVALSIATGQLAVASSLNFNQTSGASTVSGGLNFGTTATTITVGGGTLAPGGVFTASLTGGTRVTKSGAGTLDMTGTTFSGTGAFRLGIQGGFPADGGKILVNDATDLGTLQTQFNSGTIEATVPLTFANGLSIGGRTSATVPRATLAGADMIFTGASAFFPASGASGQVGMVVNNNTTLSGTMTPTTVPSSANTAPSATTINLSGTGSLTIAGDASQVLDNIYVNNGLELSITGALGGEQLIVDNGAMLTGGGTFSIAHILPAATTPNPVPELYRPSTATFYFGSTFAPTGTFAFQSNLSLEAGSSTVLSINGPTIDTEYDSIDVSIPVAASGTVSSYTLTYGGDLVLSFGAAASNGTYDLFTVGAGVSRSGGFDSVSLTGSHTGSLTNSGGVWSGTVSGVTFSFDQSTGVLTISGAGPTLSPIEQWRLTNFGVSTNTGTAADSADFDNDGIPNLIEYATGTEPDAYNASAVVQGRDGDFLTLSYTKISDPSLTYTVQATGDLAVAFTAGAGSSNTSGGITTYKDNVSLSTAGVRRFLRLEVTRAE